MGGLRLAESADGERVAAIYAPLVRDTVISFEIEPPDGAEMARRIERTLPRWPWLVAHEAGEVVGYAYAGPHGTRYAYQWSVDVSIYLDAGARGRGVGRALYTGLFALLVAQGFVNSYAGVTLPNAASVGLHESMGFSPVGVYRAVGWKFGAWHDVGWWSRPLQPTPEGAPPPPIDVHALPQATVARCLDVTWPGTFRTTAA